MPRTDTDAFALAAAHFEDVVTVRDFSRDIVRPIVHRFANNDHEDGTIVGLFVRSLSWLGTLAELKHPQHFQAALAGTRTLLEICIDLVLLHHDRTNFTPSMVITWERSAKLKAAERTRRCFDGRGLPSEYSESIAFLDREGAAIRRERATAWPNRTKPQSHPERWTARTLDADAEMADSFGSYGLRDYYGGRFAELCWGTHGSGLTGVRFINEDVFPGLIAMAFHDSARFGILAGELALRYFNKFDAIAEARFRELQKTQKRWRTHAWAKSKGYVR